MERPKWGKLYSNIKPGDTIVFDEVSRMSRNADEGFDLYTELYEKGVHLVFLKEPHINTEMYSEQLKKQSEIQNTQDEAINKILNGVREGLLVILKRQFKSAFEEAQKEVDFLRQRTREGIETARLNGKQIGSKTGSTYKIKVKEPIKEIIKCKSKDFEGTNSDLEVMAIINATKYVDAKKIEKYYHVAPNTYYKYKKELKSEYVLQI